MTRAILAALVALAASAAVGFDTGRACAQDADALLTEGVRLREQGRDDEALALFRRAQSLRPSARALAQIGLACQALGRWVEAETHVRQALDASDDPWIVANRATLQEALTFIESQLGTLEVRGAVAGAEVRIDGHPTGTMPLPAPLRLRTGRVTLEVSAPGYYRVVRDVVVAAGEHQLERIELQALPESAEPPAATSPPRGRPQAPQPQPTTDPPSFRLLVEAASGLSFVPVIGGQDEESPGVVFALGLAVRIRLTSALELLVGVDASLRPGWANRDDGEQITSGGLLLGLEATSGIRVRPAAATRALFLGAALSIAGLSYSGTYVDGEDADEERLSELDGVASVLADAGLLLGASERWEVGVRGRFGFGFSSTTPAFGLELRVGFALL